MPDRADIRTALTARAGQADAPLGRETVVVEMIESAMVAADEAATRSGVTVRAAESIDDLTALHAVFEAVWGRDTQPPVNMIRAIQHAGGYVAVAEDADHVVVAASLGFLGRHHGEVVLHSHITGALPAVTGRGVGFALKQHQRAWCLRGGIATVLWTFDPLIRRNAYFNLTKLGAEATEYHPHFYGAMDDAVNAGDETDRVVATWRLDSDRAIDAASGAVPADVVRDGVVALDIGADGGPVVLDGGGAQVLLHRVPPDYAELRRRDEATALAWRHAVRKTVGVAIDEGYVGTAVTGDGCYVLRRR